MGRDRFALAAAIPALVVVALAYAPAQAAEKRALIQGVSDRALGTLLERAVGEEKRAATSRIDARRRARKAAETVVSVLRSEGYYDYTVDPDIGEGDRPQAIVKVDPGPRYSLVAPDVAWVGDTPALVAQDASRAAILIKPGDPGQSAAVIGAEGRVVAALQQNGYADAKTTPREVIVDHADRTVRPTYKIAAGPLVKLDGLDIAKIGRTKPRWLRSLTPWKPGATYRPELVAELERRLLDTQAFDQVTVALSPKTDAEGRRPVLVSLADRPRHTLELSAGYATTEGPDFDIRWNSYNRLGRADTLSYQARLAQINSRLGVDLTLPDFGRPDETLHPSAQIFRNDTDAYVETGAQLAIDLTRRYGKSSYFTRGISLSDSQVEDKHTGSINIVALRLLGGLVLDRSDNTLDPHRGYKLEIRGQPTAIAGGENILYLKALAQGTYYRPLDRDGKTVIAARLRVGSILSGDIPRTPASDRFYSGGGGSVRGYSYQSVGPHYSDKQPIGGLALVETSLELRRQVTRTIGVVGFVDTGAVSSTQAPDFGHPFTGIGVGLRYNLGFAPIRIDIATPLQQPGGAKQPPIQLYLSIGQSF